MLTQQPDYAALAEVDREKDRIFQSYADIVNGIGQTFAGTPVEIVLHDTRNPLRSIVAVQNPISGRRLGDTNTNFGIQLIKNYSYGEGQGQGRGASFVSYDINLKDGRAVKSTTIPIFHDVYGLIGFICINIDISKMDKKHPEYVDHFVDAFKATIANDAISEMIQNSKRKN
jgi:predicted transcriptional regulator YheO